MLAVSVACVTNAGDAGSAALLVGSSTYTHSGFAAGPVVFTDGDGHRVEERRTDPFGASIDAIVRGSSGDVVGPPDVVARDLNSLNKRTDAATGWSDHGARWLSSHTARWHSTDPPVAGPNMKYMNAPWGLHPYHYGAQNPVAYWDPDGREPKAVDELTARAAYEDWKNKWKDVSNLTTAAHDLVGGWLRNADPVGYTEAMDFYRNGRKDALGPVYRFLDEWRQIATAQLSQSNSVLITIEGKSQQGPVPTFVELSIDAASGARAADAIGDVGLAAIGFRGLGGVPRFGGPRGMHGPQRKISSGGEDGTVAGEIKARGVSSEPARSPSQQSVIVDPGHPSESFGRPKTVVRVNNVPDDFDWGGDTPASR